MKFKFNNQLLIVCALFVLLVVLCFSWVSRELFSEHNGVNHNLNGNHSLNGNGNHSINSNHSLNSNVNHGNNMVNSSNNVSPVNAMSR